MLSTPQSVPAVFAYSGLDGIDWFNNTGSIVAPGQVIQLPSVQRVIYGVTRQTIPIASWGNLAIVGIFDLKLDGASTFVTGDSVFWNANTNQATSSGSYSSDRIGSCVAPTAGRTDVSVRTRLASFYGGGVLGPATLATLIGPTTGFVGTAATYTVQLNGLSPSPDGVSVPVASTNGWTVTTSPVVIAAGQTFGTFTVTPTTANTSSVTMGTTTPSLILANTPISLVATALPATEIMWGWSTNTTLTSGQIVALQNNASKSSPGGTYNYAIPSGANYYYYLCYPDSWGDFTSAMIGSFNWSVAGTGDAGGSTYSNSFTGGGIPYTYALVSVINPPAGTVNYRVFRSQFYVTTATSVAIVVS